MKVRIITVFLVLAFATSVSAEEVKRRIPFLGGAGATSCASWVAERSKPESVLMFGLEDWILGFVSGANGEFLGDGENSAGLFQNLNEHDILMRVDVYCRQHVSNILFSAASFVRADILRTRADMIRRDQEKR